MMTTRTLLSLIPCVGLTSTTWASPNPCVDQGYSPGNAYDGTNSANAWSVGATDSQEFSLLSGAWLVWTTAAGPENIKIVDLDGNAQQLNVASVLINQVENSYPKPVGAVPSLSLVSFDSAIHSAGDTSVPAIVISPESGSFNTSVAATITVHAGYGVDYGSEYAPFIYWVERESLGWDTWGTKITTEGDVNTVTLAFVEDDVYRVQVEVDDGAGGKVMATQEFELIGGKAWSRDSDGDGLPDMVEQEAGLSPFESDATQDRDGDGWTDFQELMRGTNPDWDGSENTMPTSDDPNSDLAATPVDADDDGWSDWDEELRGTDPNDKTSTPSARRLYEVEYNLEITTQDDNETGFLNVAVLDLQWDVLYESSSDSAFALSDSQSARVPAGTPMVVRSYFSYHDANNEDYTSALETGWVGKSWVEASADVDALALAQEVMTQNEGLNDIEAWREIFANELSLDLVASVSSTVTESTGLGVALVEAALANYEDITTGIPVLLGNEHATKALDAVRDIQALYTYTADYEHSFDQLQSDLSALTVADEVLDYLVTSVSQLIDDETRDGSVPSALAIKLQQDTDATMACVLAQVTASLGAESWAGLNSIDCEGL